MLKTELGAAISGEVFINITNLNGRNIYKMKHRLPEGYEMIKLEMSDFESGIYVVQIITAQGVMTYKIEKSN